MTSLTLIRRNLRYYARTHLGVAAGAFLAAMVLTGALITGDSLRHSLREITRLRLGKARFAVTSSPRFFLADLADRLSASVDAGTAAVLHTRGLCETAETDNQTVNTRIYGVTEDFWTLAPAETSAPDWGERGVAVNEPLANKLGVDVGDDLVVRTQSARSLSSDMTFSGTVSKLQRSRVTIVRVLGDRDYGRFSLDHNQTASPAVFLPHNRLSADIDIPGRANLLLVAQNKNETLDEDTLRRQLRQVYTLEDAELELTSLDNAVQLQSPRIFLDKTVEAAAEEAGTNPARFLTYFVHGIAHNTPGASTPFVFVTATDDEDLIRGMREGEITVTDWLAEDLDAHPGALLQMTYLKPTRDNRLAPHETTVIMKRVIPQDTSGLNPALTPPYPGLTDVESCTDWEPGVPLDLDRLRPKDEAYWDSHGPTPRALISLSFGQKLWGNRFGSLTAVRFPAESNQESAVRESLRANLTPESLGVRTSAPFAEGRKAGSNTTNFTHLFLGMSFFLLVAALVLVALLFVFTVEQRDSQTGLLRALGFPARRIRRFLRTEGMVLALAGILPGTLAGAAYNVLVLTGLATIWRDVVGTSHLVPWIRWQALAWGAGVTLLLSWLVLRVLTKRRTTSSPLINLLHHEGAAPIRLSRRSSLPFYIVAVLLAAGAVLNLPLIGLGNLSGSQTTLTFFLCGALTLLAAFCIVHAQLIRLTHRRYGTDINLRRMGWRNAGRRPWRSMATVVMLGCGVFLVLAVGGNRQLAGADAHLRQAGTGGFAFYGESALAMDLTRIDPEDNLADGRELPENLHRRMDIIPLLTQGTEQANCLNLHRVNTPRLLGVNPAALADRHAFRFRETVGPIPSQEDRPGNSNNDDGTPKPANAWELLNVPLDDDDAVPGIADSATIQWGLNKKVGDTISYTDESGNTFRVKLVGAIDNSIFQGSILVHRDTLRHRFTNTADMRAMLVEVPEEYRERTRSEILRVYGDRGLVLTPAGDRLQAFLAVQNTYLSIFLVLGGLGVLIGTAGLAIVVSRNTAERIREFAILRAVGFSRTQVRAMLIWEHLFLAAAGLLCALAGTAAGMLPPLIRGGSRIPWTSTGIILALLTVAALFWVVHAAVRNTRGELLADLRHE